MTETVARETTKEAQLARYIAVAQAAGLTIYGIAIGPKRFFLLTHPLGESPPAEDAADRYLREQANAGKARRRA